MILGAVLSVGPVWAADIAPVLNSGADILVLGEIHDNPAHHRIQADIVARAAPRAVVFEMLSPAQAAAAEDIDRTDAAALEAAFGWAESGWPDFAIYAPIFAASGAAALVGAALPAERDAEVTERFRLDQALSPEEQAARETLQAEAHCDMLPEDILPRMVARQRLADGRFAAATLDALRRYGAPVVLITGNGHARTDWAVPFLIAEAAPDVRVHALGQVEGAAREIATFDSVIASEPVERGDPCDAFR